MDGFRIFYCLLFHNESTSFTASQLLHEISKVLDNAIKRR